MPRARAILCLSGSFLMLAWAFHLGASSARAQVGASTASLPFQVGTSGNPLAIFENGDVYERPIGGAGWEYRSNVFGGTASGRTILSAGAEVVAASSGEVFWNAGQHGYAPWVNLGVPPGGPTSIDRESLGQVKARYR